MNSHSTSPWLRFVLGLLLCALSVAMLYFSMPPYGIWPLMLLGFAPMLVAQYRVMPRRISAVAPAITVSFFIVSYIFETFGNAFWQVPFLQALLPGIALIVFLAESGSRNFHEQTRFRWFALEGALAWVGVEMIRNLIPWLGTGGFVGYAYYRSPWLIQPLSFVGVLGLDLLSMLACYTIGLGAIALFDRLAGAGAFPVPSRVLRAWLVGVGSAAALWTVLSLALYVQPVTTPLVKVGTVQSGKLGTLGYFIEGTYNLAEQGVELIVWPEGALHYDPQVELTAEIQALAKDTGAYLVTGAAIKTSQGLRNEALVISPQGQFLGVYGKDHPLTLMGETSLTRGTYPVYQTSLGGLGTIICFDLEFNDTARKLALGGAHILGVPSNDWPALAERQVAYAVFRAVENRVALVKGDTFYDSLVIDARGNLLASLKSEQGIRGELAASVPLGTADAPYSRLGDLAGWVSLVGMVSLMVVNPLVLKRLRKQ